MYANFGLVREHAVQLDLIGRQKSISVRNLEESVKMRTVRHIYGALLNCCVRQLQTEKSLDHLRKMKEMDFASSPLHYNGPDHVFVF